MMIEKICAKISFKIATKKGHAAPSGFMHLISSREPMARSTFSVSFLRAQWAHQPHCTEFGAFDPAF